MIGHNMFTYRKIKLYILKNKYSKCQPLLPKLAVEQSNY